MKKLQLYLCLLLFAIGHTMLAQNPFTKIKQSAKDQGIFDQDILTRDIVHLDDVIVDGSLCVGLDCVDGESFGFDTTRLKENNLRMHFDDTSVSASFPANDWRFIFNDSSNGGANYFALEDATGGRQLFRVNAGAPVNSLLVDSQGDVMMGTETVIGVNGSIGIGTQTPNSSASIDLRAIDKGLQLNRLTNQQRTDLGTALGAGEVGVVVFDTEDGKVHLWDGTEWIEGAGGNTDNQGITLNVNSLELENGGTVDLTLFLDNTDEQTADVFQLNGNDLELSLEDDGVATQTVDLSGYLDNTDTQNISGSGLAGNILTIGIENGTSEDIDLSSLSDSGTDDQQLSINGNSLDLEDGGSVDLVGFLDNTDNQEIAILEFDSPNLKIEIEGGNVISVNISSLITDLQDENDAQQEQIDAQFTLIQDLILRMEIQEDCACDPLGLDDFNLQPEKAYLLQNVPNPFDNNTVIGYFIPLSYSKANIIISNINGQILDNINLSQFGDGFITVDKARMATATYLYTLYVDGKKVDTRRMIVE